MNIKDPVCGRKLDIDEVGSAIDHDGWTYFFCSDSCRTEFAVSPGRFAKEAPNQFSAKRGHSAD